MDNVTHLEEGELSPDELARLAQDEKRWERMAAGGHLDDWLAFGPSLLTLRHVAMKVVHTNRPTGRPYIDAFGALVAKHFPGMMADKDKKSVSYILWLHGEPKRLEILQKQRDVMTAGARSRLNTPKAAYDVVCRELKRRDEAAAEEIGVPIERKPTPVAVRDKIIRDLSEENAALKAKVDRDAGGSLFDLKQDRVEDIAAAVVANVTESRALKIAEAIKAAAKAKRKPAG